MKKLAWIMLLFVLPCLSQTDIKRTDGGLNGRFWDTLSSTSKLFFIMGFDDAIGTVYPNSERVYFSKVPYSDIVKGVDRFYQEPENLMFPVSDALQIFTIKANGATQAEVEAKMAEFRREIKATEDLLKKAEDLLKKDSKP
jgi:hypothetical protein